MKAQMGTVLLILTILSPMIAEAQNWSIQPAGLSTRWAASVDPADVWPEYPRPQLVRPTWKNLNGLWEYAITQKDATAPTQYAGYILVPYPVESALSGVKKSLLPDQLLWYRRTLQMPAKRAEERVLLHFGAVDYQATVYVNEQRVGTHTGGYQSFTFEITDALKSGENQLVVQVFDPTETGPNSHGKQSLHPEFMFYSPSSGIWQTVWLEYVPSTYIQALKLTPDIDRGAVHIEVALDGDKTGHAVEAVALAGGKVVGRQAINGPTALRIPRPRLWSPDDPHLYDLQVRVSQEGRVVDSVSSYFGLRKIELRKDQAGRARIHLNNRYTYSLGVVDQGFWPDGLYTAPSDAALKFDVQTVKALGFNTVRKHLKLESQRWYYHCDRLGLLVWQDMPSSRNGSPQARAQFEWELGENLSQLHNHPSIAVWVLFNEGWGAYDQPRLAEWMARTDPSRLLNGHSGPFDQIIAAQLLRHAEPSRLISALGGNRGPFESFQETVDRTPAAWMSGSVIDMHFYPGPRMFPARADAASVAGEHGSFGVYVEGHVWNELETVGAGLGGSRLSPLKMLQRYADGIGQLIALEKQGLSGSAYFQLSDVEREQQGFLTYDRKFSKVPIQEIERLNSKLVRRARNYAHATEGFSVASADPNGESERYVRLLSEYGKGQRDLNFLKRLALMALRQNDQQRATEVGNAFVAHAPRPFSKGVWESVVAITRTSKDAGFELLRAQAGEANALLRPHEAERKIVQIITRELVTPYFNSKSRDLGWKEFEKSVADRYGVLGREAVYGAWMMDDLIREDWTSFGTSYVRYFQTAKPRSSYSLHSLSYKVLKHVNDERVLNAAIESMSWQINSPREFPVFGRYDPTELDTYAGLLRKVCRNREALQWQQKAVELSDARDQEIVENWEKMKEQKACHAEM